MKQSLLSYLICPACSSSNLTIGDNLLAIVERNGAITEGTLLCCECEQNYPILQGLPVLVKDLHNYVTKNKSDILSCLHNFNTSETALDLINDIAAHSIYGNQTSQESWQSQEGINTYIYNQYVLESRINESYFNPPYDGYNFYRHIAKLIDSLTNTDNDCLVDLGCGTGGILYHLRNTYSLGIGLDYSFSALFSAQRLQTGIPTAKTNYNFFETAQKTIKREISVQNPKNVHFIVGDATNPPLCNSVADIVTSINLLEIVSNPIALVTSINRLLNPKGRLINSTPYYWRNDRSPKDLWPEKNNDNDSAAFIQMLKEFHFNINSSIEHVPWPIRFYERYWQIWDNHVVIASKVS